MTIILKLILFIGVSCALFTVIAYVSEWLHNWFKRVPFLLIFAVLFSVAMILVHAQCVGHFLAEWFRPCQNL